MQSYRKYKWFYTSSGKLVVGGKSATQNDELLEKVQGKKYYVMHTSGPGSPFCVIVGNMNKVDKKDLKECAIYCGSFSRAWKQRKKTTEVHVFTTQQLMKGNGMKDGTWGVLGKVKNVKIMLELFLAKQKSVFRALPFGPGLKVCPGKVDKKKMIGKILGKLGENSEKEQEIDAALPAGGVKICH